MHARPRVVLIGVGGFGRAYLRTMTQEDTGADLTAIVDNDPAAAAKFPVIAQRRIPVYASLEDFFARDTADLAIIVTPVHFHLPMAQACFAHGLHVLCEKPLCMTLEEAQAMEDAAQAAGRFLALAYQMDYRRDVLALKRDIMAGRFGKARRMAVCHAFRRGAAYYARNRWAGHILDHGREVFDSPFANASAHNFQMLTFLLGDSLESSCAVTGVEGELFHGNPAVENYDIAALRCHTDVGAELLYYTAHPLRTEYFGPYGVMEFEKATITYQGGDLNFRAVMADGSVVDYAQSTPHGEMQKLYDAIDCILHGGTPLCGAKADQGHIQAVRMAQELPIRTVREELRLYEEIDGDRFVLIDGLEDVMLRSMQAWALPSEIGISLT
ncbi:MAG: Gfo/Idh/MocA family protein [Aristaeellaceae bacterium]